MREIVLDTETTGLKHEEGDKITDIACVEIVDKEPTGRIFQQYIYPERLVSEESISITGLTNEFLSDKPKFIEIVDDFLEFIGNDPIVAHNAAFDIGFINSELQQISYQKLNNLIIDTLQMARKKFQTNNSLNGLCKRYKISLNDRKLHGALLDAKLLAKVYGYLSFEEDSFSFDDNDDSNNLFNDIKDFGPRPSAILSEDDLLNHENIMSIIKNLSKK
jgi:DNA polymerase-3 subunit epsilon